MRRARWTTMVMFAAIGIAGSTIAPLDAAAAPRPERVAGQAVTAVPTNMPAGTTAVLANLTMVDGLGAGYITADRCSTLGNGPQTRANGNHLGQPVANLAVVPIDTDGRFCVYNQSAVNLVVDVQGSFAPPTSGGQMFVPVEPIRILDTRSTPSARAAGGSITRVATGVPPGTGAVMVDIALVDGTPGGYVTAGACSTMNAGPQPFANGIVGTAPAANLSVVTVDPDGSFCVYSQFAVDLVVDLEGRFAPTDPAGVLFAPASPVRVLDTRGTARPANGSITRVTTAAVGATAVLANLAMVGGSAPGYITAGRCSALTAVTQTRANGTHDTASPSSNLAAVAVDADGSFCIFNQTAVDLVVDVQGSFGPNGTQQFFAAAPRRILDTRPPGGEPAVVTPGQSTARTSCRSVVHIGDSTSVGMIAPNYIKDPALRIDAQYRRVGVTDPRMEISGARSIVETLKGQVNARDTAAAQRSSGYRGCWVFALGTTDTANLALAPSGVSRRERIDRMMAVADGEPVLWVNTVTILTKGEWSNPYMQLWNQELAAAARRYPNLRIYDWASVPTSSMFSGDGIHYTVDGYAFRARSIADALTAAYPATS